MVVHESNFHAPCCEACGKEWGKTVPTAESDPFVMVLTELHVHGACIERTGGLDRMEVDLTSREDREAQRDLDGRFD